MFAVKGNEIFIFANGSVRKVPRYNMQLCEKENEESEIIDEEKQKGGSVILMNKTLGKI